MRAHEDAILQSNTLKDGGVILYLYPRANLHMSIDVNALSDVALLADTGILAHLNLTPDAGSHTHLRRGRYLRRRVDIDRRQA
jgi:hypothetical protein